MKKKIILLFLIALILGLSAQDIKRPFKNMEKGDYEKARELFEKNLLEDSLHVASNFGMGLVYSEEKSTLLHILDAWEYIERMKDRTNEFTPEELLVLKDYFWAVEERKSSRAPQKKIELTLEKIENQLIKYIREENDLAAVYEVLERYPNYKHYDNIIHIRNQFEFRRYEKENTVEGYNEFIDKFPDAAQIDKAKKYRNRMALTVAETENTEDAYNAYIRNYPESELLQKAIKKRNETAYNAAKAKNSLVAYEHFVDNYPDALQMMKAKIELKGLLFEEAKRVKTLEAYNKFIKLYPEGAQFIDVFNLKSGELGNRYYEQLGFRSADFKWAKAFDNKEQLERAQAMAVMNNGSTVVAGTTQPHDSACTDVWILKLDKDGRIVWNKTIGQKYNEQVQNIHISSSNEIIVLGYTQVASDTSKYMGWMFMLDENGKKMWNKNLGEMTIVSSVMSPKNKLYVSAYISDTIPDSLHITSYDLAGNKGWERKYVQEGVLSDIVFTNNKDVLLCGGKWLAKTDSMFYIKWEDTLNIEGVFTLLDAGSERCNVLSRDSMNTYLHAYTLEGQKQFHSKLISDSTSTATAIFTASDNNTLIVFDTPNGNLLMKINVSATETLQKKLTSDLQIVAVVQNNMGDVSYLLKGEDYVLLTFGSIGF